MWNVESNDNTSTHHWEILPTATATRGFSFLSWIVIFISNTIRYYAQHVSVRNICANARKKISDLVSSIHNPTRTNVQNVGMVFYNVLCSTDAYFCLRL